MPPERKYFESEKMAYLMAAATTITIIVTGLLKVAAHSLDVPAGMMAIVTPAHDIATVVMLAFILPHIFFAAILPSSWPILRSMFTGLREPRLREARARRLARRTRAAPTRPTSERRPTTISPSPPKRVA